MTNFQTQIQKIGLAVLFSLISWIIVNQFIVEISIVKYFFVELTFAISQKVYNFTIKSLNLES